ncbi:DUF1471 domain-containing protein [Serratia ureilytica]
MSVSGISGSPHDAITALKEKPRRTAPAITALSVWIPRDSSNWRGNAEIYR